VGLMRAHAPTAKRSDSENSLRRSVARWRATKYSTAARHRCCSGSRPVRRMRRTVVIDSPAVAANSTSDNVNLCARPRKARTTSSLLPADTTRLPHGEIRAPRGQPDHATCGEGPRGFVARGCHRSRRRAVGLTTRYARAFAVLPCAVTARALATLASAAGRCLL
jgi:hypothetical protein